MPEGPDFYEPTVSDEDEFVDEDSDYLPDVGSAHFVGDEEDDDAHVPMSVSPAVEVHTRSSIHSQVEAVMTAEVAAVEVHAGGDAATRSPVVAPNVEAPAASDVVSLPSAPPAGIPVVPKGPPRKKKKIVRVNTFFPEQIVNEVNVKGAFVLSRAPLRGKDSSLLALLARQWVERHQTKEETGASLKNLFEKARGIKRVVKPDAYVETTTEEEKIIQQRIDVQRKAYGEFEKRERLRKIAAVLHFHYNLSEKEAEYALQECDMEEEEACQQLVRVEFLRGVRKRIAVESDEHLRSDLAQAAALRVADEVVAAEKAKAKAKGSPRKQVPGRHTAGGSKKNYKYSSRINLDDAVADAENMTGWSGARVRAWKLRHENPNAYYYRFNAPGEKQGKGAWSKAEQELLKKRIEQTGTGKWGLVSMAIPGRVGYQCANQFRKMIEAGILQDDNYVIDSKGKAHFITSSGKIITQPGKKSKSGKKKAPPPQFDVDMENRKTQASSKRSTRKRKRNQWSSDEDDDDGDNFDEDSFQWKPSSNFYSTKRLRGVVEDKHTGVSTDTLQGNPLPDVRDPITLEPVEQPAISPYGHVMGYATWRQVLSERGACPFTQKDLALKDLVRLTLSNIEEHRGSIINM